MVQEYSLGKKEIAVSWEMEGDREFWVEYILVEEKTEEEKAYGIRLIKNNRESAYTGLISHEKKPVVHLIERMMRCDITPFVLNEIVDDWYAQEQ